jgi:hypothetical protein
MANHRIGHSLVLFGAFLLLASISILSPASELIVRAFGNSDVITLTNNERELLNLSDLKTNTRLTSAAQAKADDMARLQFFAHVAPDGTMAWDYIKKAGYTYEVAGENLAITNESVETVMKSWMNSPSHRENITNSEYQDIGIGIAQYGEYQGHKNTTVVVALYAKSGAVQVIGAPTNPGGSAAILQPKYAAVPPALLVTSAVALIILGSVLELRHIRRLHHKLN